MQHIGTHAPTCFASDMQKSESDFPVSFTSIPEGWFPTSFTRAPTGGFRPALAGGTSANSLSLSRPQPHPLQQGLNFSIGFFPDLLLPWLLASARLLRVPWTARRSNQSILKEISPGISLEGMMLKLKLQYFGHLMQRGDSLEKTLMLGGIGGKGEGDDRGWDGWMASLTRWTWVWVNSGSWWWTGRPGVLRFMGSQRVGQLRDWSDLIWCGKRNKKRMNIGVCITESLYTWN